MAKENQNQNQNQNQSSSQNQQRSQGQSQGSEQNQQGSQQQNQDPTPLEQQLSKELKELKEQQGKEEGLRQQILADPDIAAIFQARKENKAIKIVAADEVKEIVPLKKQITEQVDSGDVKMNEMTNSELLEVLMPAIEASIQAKADETRDVAVNEADARFSQIESNQGILHKALTEQLAAAQTVRLADKYIDFEQFKDDTMRVRKENPSLPLEKCYLLAKAEAGSTIPTANDVGTERPGSPVRRTVPIGRDPGRRTDYGSNANRTSSDQVFRNILDKGIAKVLARRRGVTQ